LINLQLVKGSMIASLLYTIKGSDPGFGDGGGYVPNNLGASHHSPTIWKFWK